MKRNLLILITMIFISHNVIAEEKTGFYLKGSVGVNKLNDAKDISNNPIFAGASLKSKSKFSPNYSIGIGYYINDFIRTDLLLDYSCQNFKTANHIFNYLDQGSTDKYLFVNDLYRKAELYFVSFSGYLNILNTNDITVFIGGGAGLAQLKEKITILHKEIIRDQGDHVIESSNDKSSFFTKKAVNFAHSLTIGTAVKLTETVNLELAYSWKDYGKTKPKLNNVGHTKTKNHYRGHNIGVGIRFDI